MREGLGDWIRRRSRKGVEKQGKKAEAELAECSVPEAELRMQWKLQQEAQLSLRARKSLANLTSVLKLNSFHIDAPTRLKKELDKVLSLQGDIEVVEKTIQATRSAINHDSTPPAAHTALKSLEKSHTELLAHVESLYASLNVHDTFPELEGMSLEFVRTLLIARDLKINIRKRAIASFFEWDKLDRAVGGKANPLGTFLFFKHIIYLLNTITGTKLHQQTQKAISKREPALKTAIRKFNGYCDTLAELAEADSDIDVPTPSHLSTKIDILRDDPYLMEDVWIHPKTGPPPRWITDVNVRKGIRAMLKKDRCQEELRRLGLEADNLCRWFGRELAAVKLASRLPASESFPDVPLFTN